MPHKHPQWGSGELQGEHSRRKRGSRAHLEDRAFLPGGGDAGAGGNLGWAMAAREQVVDGPGAGERVRVRLPEACCVQWVQARHRGGSSFLLGAMARPQGCRSSSVEPPPHDPMSEMLQPARSLYFPHLSFSTPTGLGESPGPPLPPHLRISGRTPGLLAWFGKRHTGHRCASAQLYRGTVQRCTDTQAHRGKGEWMLKYTASQTHRSTDADAQMHGTRHSGGQRQTHRCTECTGARIYGTTDTHTQIHRSTDTQTHRRTDMRVHRPTDVQAHRCAGAHEGRHMQAHGTSALNPEKPRSRTDAHYPWHGGLRADEAGPSEKPIPQTV